MRDDKPTFAPDRPMYDTPRSSALHALHQPEARPLPDDKEHTRRPGIVDRATLKQIYQTLTKNQIHLDKNGDQISFSPPNHQPEHLYAKEPCPDCQTKQAQIDTLRTALAGLMVWMRAEDLERTPAYNAADAALRETKP